MEATEAKEVAVVLEGEGAMTSTGAVAKEREGSAVTVDVVGMAGAVAFSTIGAHAYVGAKTRISRDVPPFMIVEGHDARVRGVNVVGLQRSGFTEADIAALRDAYRALWRSERPLAVALEELGRAEDQNPHVARLVASLERTERGLKGRYRESLRQQFTEEGRQRILGAASPEA